MSLLEIDTGQLVVFTVWGEAVPAGSKTSFGKGRVVDSGEKRKKKMKTSEWRSHVQKAAGEAMADSELFPGALNLLVTFYMPRPKGHFGTGRNAGTLKKSAPAYPIVMPDTTKLLRAVEDAMTGVVWRDDAQVVDQHARKVYATGPAHVYIAVHTQIDVDAAAAETAAEAASR